MNKIKIDGKSFVIQGGVEALDIFVKGKKGKGYSAIAEDVYGDMWVLYWAKKDYEQGLPPFLRSVSSLTRVSILVHKGM